MPVQEGSAVVFEVRFVAPYPMVYDGLGIVEPGAILSVADCKRVFGDDWAPGFVFEPVSERESPTLDGLGGDD
ncbi:MAG: hypothetical protein NZ959_10370 [Armatimonadetes bacterium]|nr:hypothetical protein [Armatimonadota bacterium]MDW8122699.1 hypothetical protein [Armatimonadota bacterium]